MITDITVVGDLGTNCYFAGDKNELFVIDPGADADVLLEKIKKNGYKAKYILLTHCHYDHIGAASRIKAETNAKIGIYDGEKDNFLNPSVTLSAYFGDAKKEAEPDFTFSDGEILKSGEFEFKVIHTPGHTSGSVCLLSGNTLFSGDTLFYLSFGRYDFPTGNLSDLSKSVNQKLFALNDDVVCYPGHGEKTTIGFEKQNNPLSLRGAL